MLMKISVQQLAIGMHVAEFSGWWIDHPYWRSGFTIVNAGELQGLRDSSLSEVWIDCSRGARPGLTVVHPPPTDRRRRRRTEAGLLDDEMQRASCICIQARAALAVLLAQARLARPMLGPNLRAVVRAMAESLTRHPQALLSQVCRRVPDEVGTMHALAVGALMLVLARELGLSERRARAAALAGLLHDLGKVADSLLVARQDEGEYGLMCSHATVGHELLMLNAASVGPEVLDVSLHHHERLDGSGYPDRLSGAQISLFARMAAVCDAFDAMTSRRPYDTACDPAEALRRMTEGVHSQFDAAVLRAFVRILPAPEGAPAARLR